jgi:hypothetical protein
MSRLRWTLGLTLLALQVVALVQARFGPARYFAWAPFDMRTDYRIEAEVDGRPLGPDEIKQRYHLRAEDRDMRSWHHVLDIIARVEARQDPSEPCHVRVHYAINGRPELIWELRRP